MTSLADDSLWLKRKSNKWTRGLCCSMAIYLHFRTGYPIWAIVHHVPPAEANDLGDWPELGHAFVMAPDGRVLDANGYGTVAEMGGLGMVWEAEIGDDKHPTTGRKGQWWLAKLKPLTISELCVMREACHDPIAPATLQKAHAWFNDKESA